MYDSKKLNLVEMSIDRACGDGFLANQRTHRNLLK
jgi:hypothetical protein